LGKAAVDLPDASLQLLGKAAIDLPDAFVCFIKAVANTGYLGK
jgi:hypothetical protein